MAKGFTYVAIWIASAEDPAIGTVSVYNANTGDWVTSYAGKGREIFRNGVPRGSVDSKIDENCGINPPPLPG